MPYYTIEVNGADFGEYHAGDKAAALDKYAKDAGYASYADVIEQFGDDADVRKIDTERLIRDAERITKRAAFQSVFPGSVAVVSGVECAEWSDVAALIGCDLREYLL